MANYKAVTVDLLSSITSSYDNTKTTIAGDMALKAISGSFALTPPPITWLDFFTDFAETVVQIEYTPNGRVFGVTAPTAGLARICAYSLNATTGAYAPIGKVQITVPNLAATTHTLHGFKVDDTSTSNIKCFVATTGTVAINGGVFMTNLLPLTDFTMILSVTLTMAIGSNTKGVYFLQDGSTPAIGAGQLNIATAGLAIDRTNSILYAHNGIAATHQYYLYDYSLTPNNPGQTVTTPVASPGIVNATAHGFNAGDQVQFQVSGGSLPTGLVAGTTYFVSAAGLTANAFEVSATTGGAAINFTVSSTGTQTVYRAFGITGSLWKWKTGNLPALSGVLILLNSEKYAVPGYGTGVSGFPCVFFATTTNLYLGRLSELTNGATTWASLLTSNLLGTTNQVVSPTLVQADYDDTADRATFTTSTTKIIAKKVINNSIEDIFGVLNNDYLEGMTTIGSTTFTQFGAITLTDIKCRNGWTMICGSATGQRGVIAKNSSADLAYDTTYFISKVITFESLSTLIGIAVSSLSSTVSATSILSYRTSGFGSASGGWIALSSTLLFPPGTMATQIQVKSNPVMDDPLQSNPMFSQEVFIAYAPLTGISGNWEGSVDNTSANGASPAYSAFRMTNTDSGTKYFRAIDDSGNIVASANTSANYTFFDKSTNNGTSWTPMTGANDYSSTPLTTEIRYKWTSPPGVRVTVSLGDS